MKNLVFSILTGDGMKARAIRGTALSIIGFGGSQVIRLGSNLILTRILFPEAFGLMALVLIVLAGLEMFSDIAIGPSIIQSARGDEETFLNTAWTLQILRGIVLWLAACALAIPIAHFYEQDALARMIPVVGFSTVIAGFSSIGMYTANRHLTLGRLTALELAAQVVGTLVMIGLALWLQSVWALVLGSLAIAMAKTALSHVFLPGPGNRIGWDKSAFLEIFHFGKYIFLGTIAGFFIQHGDRLVLGKFISLEELAVYTIALLFAGIPQMLNNHLVSRVLLPLYKNRPPSENAGNRAQIGQARFLLRLAFLGLGAVLALGGEPLVSLLYDSRYQLAGPLLVLVSLSLLSKIIIGGYDAILLANGNSRDFTILTVGTAVLRVIVLLVLVQNYGVLGAVLASVLIDILTYPALVYFIRPYRGWYPGQDLGFLILALAIGTLALWMSPTAQTMLADVFAAGG